MKLSTLCFLLLVGVARGASNDSSTKNRSALDRSRSSAKSGLDATTKTTTTTTLVSDDHQMLETDVDGLVMDRTKPKPTIVRRRNEKLFVVETTHPKTTKTESTDSNDQESDRQDLPKTRTVFETIHSNDDDHDDHDATLDKLRDSKQGIRELFWNLQSVNSTQTCMSNEMLDQFHQVLQKLVDMTPSSNNAFGSKTLDELEKMTDFFEKAKAPPDTDFSMSYDGSSA